MAPDLSIEDRNQLAHTIASLIGESKKDRVTWRQVAKAQEGSSDYADYLRAVAQHFNRKGPRYFNISRNGRKVKLTQDGINFVATHKMASLSTTKKVANAVKEYASGLKDKVLRVERVSHVTKVGARHIETVEVEINDSTLNLTEVPVKFQSGDGLSVRGKVVGQEPEAGRLYVSFHQRVPDSFSQGRIVIDQGFLLRQLAEAIDGISEFPGLVTQIFEQEEGPPVVDQDSTEVADQLLKLKKPWGRLLWGPPGAGKTYGVAHFIKHLISRDPGHSVLLVAPSNLAVDVALSEVVEQFSQGHDDHEQLVDTRKVTRYGYPRKPEIVERSELLGPVKLDRLSQKVRDLSDTIRRTEREEVASDEELATLRAKLLEVQEEIRDQVRDHLKKSWVVATTTTSAYLQSSPVTEVDWDTVILDEATMAPPAMCVFLGSLATDRFLITGDPRQLGPIFESSATSSAAAQEWMGKDIFDFSGVSTGTGESREIDLTNPALAQIRSQRRCTKGLWEKVEHLYPEVESRVDEASRAALTDQPPRPGEPVVLLDTDNTSATGRCRREKGSWKNEYTAGLALEVASAIAADAGTEAPSIAIISPYRAQTNLLKEAIKAEYRADSSIFDSVDVGTVHQFQGSEADIVIFDIVDGPGRSSPGVLLQGDTGIRLVNVAATRARGKLILIANAPWYRQNANPGDNRLLWRLITDRSPRESMDVQPPTRDGRAKDAKLRQCESPIEEELLQAMRRIPALQDVEPQYVIRDEEKIVSRADFAFPDAKLAVYCDGARWHLQHGRWRRDWRIRNKLQELGWTFNVFPGSDVKENPDECARQVLKTYRARSK